MAAGDTLVIFTPNNNEPPAANFATPDSVNDHLVLDFALNEIVVFPSVMPQHYGGGTIVVYMHYTMSSANSGNIELTSSFETREDGATMTSDDFGTIVITGDVAVPGTAGILDITTTTHDTYLERDSVAAGNAFHLKIERTAASTSEAANDLELWRVELREA